jgi:hypothetical protein
MKPRGRLTLTIRNAGGELVAERRTTNRVLQSGAKVIAALFTGVRKSGIDNVRFGFGIEPLALDAKGPFFVNSPVMALAADNFTVESGPDVVTVHVRVPFKPEANIAKVSEAGLFAGDDLYNHVLFEPVDMTSGQAITFFWEIEFPFGN